jgi:hypothetical protein
MTPLEYRTTTPLETFCSMRHTFYICTGIGDKIQISRIFLTGITISRGVAEITVTAEISEIPAEKKNPWCPPTCMAPPSPPQPPSLMSVTLIIFTYNSAAPVCSYTQWRSQAPGTRGFGLGRGSKISFFTVAWLHYLTLFWTVASVVGPGRETWLATLLPIHMACKLHFSSAFRTISHKLHTVLSVRRIEDKMLLASRGPASKRVCSSKTRGARSTTAQHGEWSERDGSIDQQPAVLVTGD